MVWKNSEAYVGDAVQKSWEGLHSFANSDQRIFKSAVANMSEQVSLLEENKSLDAIDFNELLDFFDIGAIIRWNTLRELCLVIGDEFCKYTLLANEFLVGCHALMDSILTVGLETKQETFECIFGWAK